MNNTENPQQPQVSEPTVASQPSPPPQSPAESTWTPSNYYQSEPRSKSSLVACCLSLVPGLGQVYVGYYRQGFVNMVIVGTVITLLSAGIEPLMPFAIFFLIFYWLYNIVDAGRRASLYNQSLAGMGPLQFPDHIESPDSAGSLIIGAVLVAIGIVALSHTTLGLSLDWLNNWWPLGLVLIGGYLIYRSVFADK